MTSPVARGQGTPCPRRCCVGGRAIRHDIASAPQSIAIRTALSRRPVAPCGEPGDHVRSWKFVAKVFLGGERKFLGPLMRLTRGDVSGADLPVPPDFSFFDPERTADHPALIIRWPRSAGDPGGPKVSCGQNGCSMSSPHDELCRLNGNRGGALPEAPGDNATRLINAAARRIAGSRA